MHFFIFYGKGQLSAYRQSYRNMAALVYLMLPPFVPDVTSTCMLLHVLPLRSGGSRNKAMGGAVILEGRHILERALAPPPPPPLRGGGRYI